MKWKMIELYVVTLGLNEHPLLARIGFGPTPTYPADMKELDGLTPPVDTAVLNNLIVSVDVPPDPAQDHVPVE